LAHDVDDFSRIWQAMGRSRTMNQTLFTIYKNNLPIQTEKIKNVMEIEETNKFRDIKTIEYTKTLYIKNCDSKVAGNLSSIYQTLISLFNLQ
jgi:hypothetical protein